MEEKPRLLILYATQTGNALDAAERVEREAERRQCGAVLLSMDEFEAGSLPDQDAVIFIVSTTGQGDIPDSMKAFWRFLLKRNLSQQWLEGVLFAVFGLGDSGYQKYNFTAKKLDRRLAGLGATPIIKIGLGDDQHPSGYEGALDPWLSSLWEELKKTCPTIFKSSVEIFDPDVKLLGHPKIQIVYHDPGRTHPSILSNSDLKSTEMQIGRARLMSPVQTRHNDYRSQCFLHMIKNQLLTKAGSDRDVRHFEFEVLTAGVEYQVGDVLEILPKQDSIAVDAFLQRCNLDPDSYITVHPTNKNNPPKSCIAINASESIKLKTFVELTMDVGSASPRRYFFEVMSFFATVAHEKEKLQYFASPEGRDDLYQYNQKERRTVLEVLEDFPSVQMPFEWLVQLVPPLKTRSFSISSSPLAHPNQVHLTISVVSWMTPFKRKRRGLCSTWLAGLDPDKSVVIPAWFHRGSLPSPPPSLPLILIGPGTGCAPFRGFVEERAIQSRLESTGAILFFFGCRNEGNDFLYRDFWLSHVQSFGVLSEEKGGGFFAAFSRDQTHKVYVQHKIQEQQERIWSLLRDGAAIYIAGSATKMPEDVSSALEDIISKENGISRESAARMLTQLEKVGRFNIEAWS